MSVIPAFEKVGTVPFATVIAALSTKVTFEIETTVVPAVIPVPFTTCPALIKLLAPVKVTVALEEPPLPPA